MNRWQTALEDTLRDIEAPPVLTRGLLARFARSANNNQPVPESSLGLWIRRAATGRKLQFIQRGLYLNRFRARPARLADAIPFLHKDAVASLATVLGETGVLNNPSTTVTAIVPLDRNIPPPHLGRKITRAGIFHFFGVPRHILEAGKADDRLEPVERHEHACATPEKALIDWLYLSESPRSHRTAPPRSDIDITLLNLPRLRRLAAATGLKDVLQKWIEQ